MKTFACVCGNPIYFENTLCYVCGRTLDYLPDRALMAAVEPAELSEFIDRLQITMGELHRRIRETCFHTGKPK